MLSIQLNVLAQDFSSHSDDKHKKEKEKLVQHINSALELKDEVSKKFWSVYYNHIEKVKALNEELRKDHDKIRDSLKILIKEEKLKIIEKQLIVREKEIELERELNKSLIKIITLNQLFKLKKIESHIKRKIRRHKMGKHFKKGHHHKGKESSHHHKEKEMYHKD